MAEPTAPTAATTSKNLEPRSALFELVRVRVLELVRDPGAIFWVFGFPLVLAFALGLAFRNRPPEPVHVGVVDGPASAWVLAALDDAQFDKKTAAEPDALLLLRRGQVDLLVVPQNDGGVRYRYDDTRPEARVARLSVERALERAKGRTDLVAADDERVIEPGSRYIDFLLPGLIGMNLLGSSMWGLGYSVVDARKKKLLKRLAATPMSRADYLLSLLLSRMLFLVVEVVALFLIGRFAFGVECQGNVLSAFVVAAVGGAAFTGLAMLIAARPQSTEVASGWLNFVMLPMWLLSGSFFSSKHFPDWLQPVVQALPLTAHNDALRAIVNEGLPLSSQLPELLLLGGWAIVPFLIALRVFRWQ